MFKIDKIIGHTEGTIRIEKKNMVTGDAEEYAQHNLLTDLFYRALALSENLYTHAEVFGKLYLGDGTAEPRVSDTALTHKKWEVESDSGTAMVSNDLRTITITTIYIVPASESYVGTVTELGLYGEFGLVTHSLLQDAEGIPYSINKTDLDQLTITYTITMTLNAVNRVLFAPMRRIRFVNTGKPDFNTLAFNQQYYWSAAGMTFEKSVLWKGKLISRFNYDLYVGAGTASTMPFSFPPGYRPNKCTYDAATKQLTIPRHRYLESHALNGHFLNAFFPLSHSNDLTNIQLLMPNPDIMPYAMLTGYEVGTGDGTTTDFIPPIPMWIRNTEEIYVDGVLQERGVDYTCDNLHNLQNNFELLPSSHMIILEGEDNINGIGGLEWYNYTNDMNLTGNYPKSTYSIYRDPNDLKEYGTQLRVAKNGPTVFQMFGEEDLAIDQTVSEVYLSVPNYREYHPFSLAYSDDAETWTEVLTDVIPDQIATANRNLSLMTKHEIAPVKAKYWKLTMKTLSSGANIIDLCFIMKHTRQPLRFTTPPASGSVITMNCTIDRPYKDDKHVIDVVGTIQL